MLTASPFKVILPAVEERHWSAAAVWSLLQWLALVIVLLCALAEMYTSYANHNGIGAKKAVLLLFIPLLIFGTRSVRIVAVGSTLVLLNRLFAYFDYEVWAFIG